MPSLSRTAFVHHSAIQMYDLVVDIEKYPLFLPWCGSARVEALTEHEVLATLDIMRGPLRYRFTTRNRMRRGERVDMDLVDGPFEHLKGRWRFVPAGEGCKVSLDMDVGFASPVVGTAVGPLFNEGASHMVEAFCRRACRVYGGG